jgi:predicted Holliday junction resolvase-like endonuclease
MAQNIIDALLVTLGLDAKGMSQGAADAVKAQQKIEQQALKTAAANKKQSESDSVIAKKRAQVEQKHVKENLERSKKVMEAYRKIRDNILEIGAAILGIHSLEEFGRDLVHTNAEIGRMSKTLGVNARDLAAWQDTAKDFGSTAEDATNAFRTINRIQGEINTTGTSGSMLPLLRAGVSSKFFTSSTSAADKMMLLSEAFSRLTGQQAAFLGGQAGFSESYIRMLQKGPKFLAEELELQKKRRNLTQDEIDKAIEIEKRLAEVKTQIEGIGNKLLDAFLPAVQKSFGWLNELLDYINTNIEVAKPLIISMSALLVAGFTAASLAALPLLATFAEITVAVAALTASIYAGYKFAEWIDKKLHPGATKSETVSEPVIGGKTATQLNAEVMAGGQGHVPRGIRNNNPGNIKYGSFAKAHGATGQDAGGFAIFPSMAVGKAALLALLKGGGYIAGGTDTISKIINKFAPASDHNNTAAYAADVSSQMGIGANQQLTVMNASALAEAISMHENGRAFRTMGSSSVSTNSSNSDIKIGAINIQTQAKDAPGIAASISPALQSYAFANNANTGLN